ncbi:MAG: YicC/YloC family endoribonuclease [Flavobacteriia bacterium]
MLLSMTGFGKATGSFQGKKVTVEVRSLNSKTLDLNVRIASNYRELEPQIRNIISAELDRGKIDVNINIDSTGDTKNFSINKDLAKAYHQDLKDVNLLIGGSTEDYLSLILRMPEIYNNEREELGDEEKAWLLGLCQDACTSLNEFRRQEGLALENEFNQRIGEIKSLLEQVPKYEQERIEIVRSKIKKGLEELQNIQIDNNRLEQEMIFYIEKLDVSEEKMRLSNHLDYYLETMVLPKSGKKLGFISQEIGREINTLGSKSNQADMQKLVVDMKDSLEKIKEQILNTL